MNLKQFIRLCGILVTVGSLILIWMFILSKAWFGVMIALFMVAAGLKAAMQPDIVRFGKAPEVDKLSQAPPSTPVQ